MILRPVTDADLPRVRDLTDTEGWGYELSDLRRLRALCGEGFLALLGDDGVLAGTLTTLPYAGAAWIGNVIVDASLRGRGAGRVLMDGAHAFCAARGLAHVYLDAYPPAIGFYRTLGYHDDGETQRWALTVPALPGEPARGLAPIGPGDLDAVTAADARVLDAGGATHRRTLLAHLMDDYPGWALAVRGPGGPLAAWGFARPGTASSELGPLAGEPAAAASLADALLARLTGRVVELSVPMENAAAQAWLSARGFTRTGWHLRMYRGARLAWDRQRTWALGGLEKG